MWQCFRSATALFFQPTQHWKVIVSEETFGIVWQLCWTNFLHGLTEVVTGSCSCQSATCWVALWQMSWQVQFQLKYLSLYMAADRLERGCWMGDLYECCVLLSDILSTLGRLSKQITDIFHLLWPPPRPILRCSSQKCWQLPHTLTLQKNVTGRKQYY